MEEVRLFLNKLIQSVEGLLAIVITDRDGVPVLKAASEQTPELVLRHNFLGTFGLAANQASKLGMGRNKSIVCLYENHQIVQKTLPPLLLTFIASSEANTGLLLDMDHDLEDILKDLQRVVNSSA